MTDQGAGRLAAIFDRYPFNSPWVRGLIGRYWLQTWFAIETFLGAHPGVEGHPLHLLRRSAVRRRDPGVAGGRRSMAGGDRRQLLRGAAADAPTARSVRAPATRARLSGARACRRGRCGRQRVDPPAAVVVAAVPAARPERHLGQRPESAGAADPRRRGSRRGPAQGLRSRPAGHPRSLAGAHRVGRRPARHRADLALAGVPRQPRRNRRAPLEPERKRAPESPAWS